jgi:ArsR family transcriptional regulator
MRPLPDIFKALADSTQLRILRALDGAELHVNEMVDVLELPQPTVSRHLGVLLHAGLVARRRDAVSFYNLDAASGAWSEWPRNRIAGPLARLPVEI